MRKLLLSLLTLASVSSHAYDLIPYEMKDCTDPISKKFAEGAAEQVNFGLKNIPGAKSVVAGNCEPMWTTKMLGGAVSGGFSPDTCGAKITFMSRENAVNFSKYADIFTGRSSIEWIDKEGYQSNVDICGADKTGY